MSTTIPLFLSADAAALIRWARRLPGDGSRYTVYRPKHQGGLQTGEFSEREVIEFFGGKFSDDKRDEASWKAARSRWEAVKDEIAQHFVGKGTEMGGHRMITNFTWGCWKLTERAEIVPDEAPICDVVLV